MELPVQIRLRLCISMALSLLPRYLRHDFWRITEPQHQRAHHAITEAIFARIDREFEVTVKERPREPTYRGTGHFMGKE
jgi:hypothetical protein